MFGRKDVENRLKYLESEVKRVQNNYYQLCREQKMLLDYLDVKIVTSSSKIEPKD